jgi:hypothetical protein
MRSESPEPIGFMEPLNSGMKVDFGDGEDLAERTWLAQPHGAG